MTVKSAPDAQWASEGASNKADKYITRTGETPAVVEVEMAVARPRKWTDAEQVAFTGLKFVGLYIATTDCPISGREYDNRGNITRVWGEPRGLYLARIGITRAPPWTAKLAHTFARAPVGIVIAERLWTTDLSALGRLEQMAEMVIAGEACASSINGYSALAPDIDMPGLVRRIKNTAMAHGVQVADTDAELHDACRRIAGGRA